MYHPLAARLSLVIVTACLLAAPASAQLRVCTYNVAQLNGELNDLEDVFAAASLDDKFGFDTPVAIYVFQEVQDNEVGIIASRITAANPGIPYATATYTNFGENGTAGAQALFYRTDLLTEDAGAHADIFTGAGRYADRWKLDLDAYDNASVYVYSCHLKAGTGGSNEALRLSGAQAMRDDADDLLAGSHIIFCGDFNVYDNGEPAYLEFLSGGPAQAIDPLGTGSWNGSGNAIKHSQSPRSASGGGLTGGGVDDRFDFQLPTTAMHDTEGLSIMTGTYRSLGNDGQHYNLDINSGNNFYYPSDVSRSNALADALWAASDHMPVIVEYQVPAVLSASVFPSDIGTVIKGASTGVLVSVDNTADAVVAGGADELDYTASGTGDVDGNASGSVGVFETPDSFGLLVDTFSFGPITGGVTVTTSSQDAQNPSELLPVTGDVIRSADPSFSGAANIDATLMEIAYGTDTGVQSIEIAVHNFGFDVDQAFLDVDTVIGLASPYGLGGPLPGDIGGIASTLPLTFDTTALASGDYPITLTIGTSDEDLPGETTHQLTLDLIVTIDGDTCTGDANGDGNVDVTDLLLVLGNWDATCECPEDVNGDGIVDIGDLLDILGFWGTCP